MQVLHIFAMLVPSSINRKTVDICPIVAQTIRILQNPASLLLCASIQHGIESTLCNMCIRNTLTDSHGGQIIHRRASRQHLSQPQTIALQTPRIARISQLKKALFSSSLHFSAVGAPPEGSEGVLFGACAGHVDEAEGDAAFVFCLGDFGGGGAEGGCEGFGGRVGEGDVDALGFF